MEYTLTADQYAEALRNGRFLDLKCGAYTVPPQKVCSECHGEDVEVAELSRRGQVRSFTVIYTAAEGFTPPYIVGLVETEEGPWVTVSIVDFNPEQATIKNLMGRKGVIDYREVPADPISGGPRIALTFKVAE
jgi:uncharacterized OB-fold protein